MLNLPPYLQNAYASWRILTGGGDHAESYLRIAEAEAKDSEKQFRDQLEDCFCDDARYSLAEEKCGSEFQRKLPMHIMQKDLAVWKRKGVSKVSLTQPTKIKRDTNDIFIENTLR